MSWRVTLEVDDGRRRSERSLMAASCDELASATALFIAILLEPSVEQPSGPKPASAESGPDPVTVEQQNAAPTRFAAGAFVAVARGLMPAWAGGFGVDGSVQWKTLHGHVGAAYFPPVEQLAADSGSQGARFRLLSASAELGLSQPILQDLSVGVCSGAELVFMHAEGFGPGVDATTQRANFVAISVGGLATWMAFERVALVLDADVLFPLGQRRFVFGGSAPTSIYRPGLGAQLALGLQFVFSGTDSP
jgi:hypothetical protein